MQISILLTKSQQELIHKIVNWCQTDGEFTRAAKIVVAPVGGTTACVDQWQELSHAAVVYAVVHCRARVEARDSQDLGAMVQRRVEAATAGIPESEWKPEPVSKKQSSLF